MSTVKLITEPNSDLKVVNAARVSMNKRHDVFDEVKDKRLINYLATHKHWTPFAHSRQVIIFKIKNKDEFKNILYILNSMPNEILTGAIIKDLDNGHLAIKHSLYGWVQLCQNLPSNPFLKLQQIYSIIKDKSPHSVDAFFDDNDPIKSSYDAAYSKINDALINRLCESLDARFYDFTFLINEPIFVARQHFKHTVGFVYNEVSRRYVDTVPEFYMPDAFRSRPEGNIKQGSGNIHERSSDVLEVYTSACEEVISIYNNMVKDGVAPEMARMILPQSMMTEFYVTGNYQAWSRFIDLRMDNHAQQEIQTVANEVLKVLDEVMDYDFQYFVNNGIV